jgi:hypothetical protein
MNVSHIAARSASERLHTSIVWTAANPQRPFRKLLIFAEILIIGYLAFGRSFAHIGVAPVYPAEVFLAASLLAGGGAWLNLYFAQLARGSAVALMTMAFFAWGLFETCRGLLEGYTALESLRGLATHYYVFLFFVGWQLASVTDAIWFVKMTRRAAAAVGVSGILIAALSHFATREGPLSLLLTAPAMPAYMSTAVIAFAPYFGVWFYPLIGGSVAALLLQPGRAAWLSMIAGGILAARGVGHLVIRRLLVSALALTLLVVSVGWLLPVTEGRGGTLSPRWLAARMVTLVSPEAAERMIAENGTAADVKEIRSISGTKAWRMRFWEATLNSLDSTTLWLAGHGYGFSLGTLIHEDVRTPHNFSVYLLGYTGFIGLALYVGLILAFLAAIWSLRKGPFRSFLMAQLAVTLVVAAFGNGLETPFVAVPFYLVMGLAYGFARNAEAHV